MAEKKPTKPVYGKPSSQLDLEAREEKGHESNAVLSTSDFYDGGPVGPDDGPGYIGVDPQYQNFANHTEAPGVSSKSVEDQVAADFAGVELEDVTPEEPEGDAIPEVEPKSSSSTPPTPPPTS